MTGTKDWQAAIDGADQVEAVRIVMIELGEAIASLEDSPYADEDPVDGQLHDLELLREYAARKLDRLLE